ncbi:TonB-dependent receptor [Psychrosphaera sp. 1_MG-2023]|uniref:TonB-dependent receptor n=1 Tax=Psychrosphaera sp. 1_MG-2023 TaxID=3062643 RepID=UPI0026E1A8D0|nr:TonB-dependent receptor [Psychrosphaera sp. 1_MG-2023]MDO6719582.1 TonB-dependent receptor [Psychrosphaera sp. 1_MG-2023]
MRIRHVIACPALFFCNVIHAVDKHELEHIEVTAQKRVESVQQVPISITTLSRAQLTKMSITQSQDIAELIPNVNTTRAISGMHNYFIRGIGLDDFNLSSVSAVGLYIDDVAINNPMLAAFTLNDIERVEVLRGPQNTLYGKNTTGGAIKFMSTSPQLESDLNGFARLSIGSFNRRFFDIASDIFINDTTGLRLSFFNHTADGQVTSKQLGNNTEYNDVDKQGFRAHLRHQFSQNIQLDMSIYGGAQDQISAVKTLVSGTDEQPTIDIDNIDLAYNQSRIIDPRNDITAFGGYFKLNWQLSSMEFNSITSFETVESERMDDWGSQNIPSAIFQALTYNSTDTNNLSQEFQLLSTNQKSAWLVGLAFNKDTGDLAQAAYIDPGTQGRPDDAIDDAGGGPLFDRAAIVETNTTTTSIYGQYSQSLTEKLQFTGGYRWTHQGLAPTVNSAGMMMDDPATPFPLGTLGWYSLGNPNFNIYQDYVGFKELNQFVIANNGYGGSANIDESFSEWGGKLALDYQIIDDTLLYASISRGFKMGAVNSNPTTITFNKLLDKVVLPETLITLEAGWKSQFLNNRLRINGAVFTNNWQNYQFYLVYNPGNPAELYASLVNLPEAKSTGAEVEVDWLIAANLQAKLGISWLDTEVTDAKLDVSHLPQSQQVGFQNQVVAGNKLTNAPELTLNGSIEKTIEFSQSELELRLHLSYAEQHIHALAGENSTIWQANFSEPAVTLLNTNVNYTFGHDRQYQLNLWVKNLTDEQFCSERATVPGTSTELVRLCAQSHPKTIGITLEYLFD